MCSVSVLTAAADLRALGRRTVVSGSPAAPTLTRMPGRGFAGEPQGTGSVAPVVTFLPAACPVSRTPRARVREEAGLEQAWNRLSWISFRGAEFSVAAGCAGYPVRTALG